MKNLWVLLAVAALTLSIFACDEAVEKGEISGNVKDDGQNVSSAYVLLLEEGKMLAGEAPLDNGSLTNRDGNYTIYLVEPDKNYYICAVKDTGGDAKYTPGEDPIGYYGRFEKTTQIWYPASIRLGSGEKKGGINVADMYVVPIPTW